MRPSESEFWIKGWFDGDYTSSDEAVRLSGPDVETTRVDIVRGRMTSIQRVSGPPEKNASQRSLHQGVVSQVHLETPQSPGWITQLHNVQILDWESHSTGSVLSGGAPRVGRLVGWAYARVIDTRRTPVTRHESPPRPTLPPSNSVTNSTDGIAPPSNSNPKEAISQTDSAEVPAQKPPEPAIDQPAPHPCELCKWGRVVLFFAVVWLSCSFGWALLAIAPLLLRCFLAKSGLPPFTTNEQPRQIETAAMLTIGLGAFGFVIWQALQGCKTPPTISLLLLFIIVPWSTRLRKCALIWLLTGLWALAMLLTCPGQDGSCRRPLADTQQWLNQWLRPDRDAQDISGQTSSDDGWNRVSVDEVEKRPEKFFTCDGKTGRLRQQYVIYMGEGALFDMNKAELSENSETQLARIGKLIQKHPKAAMMVVGHADKSPHRDGPSGNLHLSEQRAYAVVDWLISQGYSKPDHIVAMGAGDRYPLFDTPGEFRGNRRVEVRVHCPGAKP